MDPSRAPRNARITVLCVDDHPLVRDGIAGLLSEVEDIELVAEAADGNEAVTKFREHRPNVVLMDLKMPNMSGIDAIHAIRAEFPDARVIVLTTYEGDAVAQRAIQAGAYGYILKSEVRRGLLATIREVNAGQRRVSPEVAMAIALRSGDEVLSVREIGVLQQIAYGRSNKEISGALSIAEGTVKNHVKSILSKLDASDRTHAVVIGLDRGIIGI
jgi:DNA-binding NarL/FixJ family response regulator